MKDNMRTEISDTPHQNSVLFQIIAIAALWATAFAFIKMAAQAGMLPLSITAVRGALTALVIALWLFVTKSKFSTDRVTLRSSQSVPVGSALFPRLT
jgi:membrane protein YdbS with pleckstrin-like domain